MPKQMDLMSQLQNSVSFATGPLGRKANSAITLLLRLNSCWPGSNMKRLWIALLLCSATSQLLGADFDLGTNGALTIRVPEKWTVAGKAADRPDGSHLGYALALKPMGGEHAKCLITFAYVHEPAVDRERIRKQVVDATKQLVSGSVEKKQSLKDFKLSQGYGAYCVFTDASLIGKEPEGDDYRVLGSGVIQLSGNVLGVVSIFADDASGLEFKSMLEALNTMELRRSTE